MTEQGLERLAKKVKYVEIKAQCIPFLHRDIFVLINESYGISFLELDTEITRYCEEDEQKRICHQVNEKLLSLAAREIPKIIEKYKDSKIIIELNCVPLDAFVEALSKHIN